jgi:para-aminobenzoate synthetase/4-amino-4-deoxychorismate lyase
LVEALGKARPIAAALRARVPAPPEAPAPLRRFGGPRLSRPDPALGVFETLAVRDGRASELDRHLRRLEASARALYDIELPAGLDAAARARAAAAPPGVHRLRITLDPDGSTDVTTTPAAPGPPADAPLDPVLVAGGLGAHKWQDRRPLDGVPGALIVDLDGAVLEAASANVWIVEGERLVTPPADGRLLPGVTRDRLLDLGRATAEPIDLARLGAADGVVITSSIRLAAPAALRGGVPTERARSVAADLRAALTATPLAV